jgi:hypothetical protein
LARKRAVELGVTIQVIDPKRCKSKMIFICNKYGIQKYLAQDQDLVKILFGLNATFIKQLINLFFKTIKNKNMRQYAVLLLL